MARWLLSSRKLWLLDEPLTALDASAQGLLGRLSPSTVPAVEQRYVQLTNPIDISNKSELILQADKSGARS